MGSQTNNVVLAAQTGWQTLTVPGTTGTNQWFENFNEDDLDITIAVSGMTSGLELHIDDVLFVPGTLFDGSWYWIAGGQTKFLFLDEFTYADTATDAKIQRWLWRVYGRYLPHGTGTEITITDP